MRSKFPSVSIPSLLTLFIYLFILFSHKTLLTLTWSIQLEAIKSSAKDSLPALSSTARTIVSLTTVGTLVVACLQWKDANRLAEDANRLSLMAMCEGYPVNYSKRCICYSTHPSCETPIQMVSGVPYQLVSIIRILEESLDRTLWWIRSVS